LEDAVQAFFDIANEAAPDEHKRSEVLWIFKQAFALGEYVRESSSTDYARHDLREMMGRVAAKPPQFLEAFHAGCEMLRAKYAGEGAPDNDLINDLCVQFGIGYRIEESRLVLRDHLDVIPVPTTALLEEARREVRDSLGRSEQLLKEGRGREAVQNVLWLLESITTAFDAAAVDGKTVRGKYFNDIVGDLRRATKGRILEQALGWLTTIHGYLSAPRGGGVRHGAALDLEALKPHEAALFVNLIRSFAAYLLAEYERSD
jgi:hypothetical protein